MQTEDPPHPPPFFQLEETRQLALGNLSCGLPTGCLLLEACVVSDTLCVDVALLRWP